MHGGERRGAVHSLSHGQSLRLMRVLCGIRLLLSLGYSWALPSCQCQPVRACTPISVHAARPPFVNAYVRCAALLSVLCKAEPRTMC